MNSASGIHSRHQQASAGKSGEKGRSTGVSVDLNSDHPSRPWGLRVLPAALLGSILLYAAFPPLGWWPLAWFAPTCWILLVLPAQWHDRRPYWTLWFASALFWLAMLQGIRLAHWANHFGWVALSLYLAAYLPLFVGLTRSAHHQLRIPVWIAAPVVWTALELARGYLITGFSMALLSHTQIRHAQMIQLADIFGAYGISFAMILVASCVATVWDPANRRWRTAPILIGITAVLSLWCYGAWRTSEVVDGRQAGNVLRVALIQHTVDKVFDYDPERNRETFRKYFELTMRAREEHPDLDLIVWPESVFSGNLPEYIARGRVVPPPDSGLNEEQLRRRLREYQEAFLDKTRQTMLAINGASATGNGSDERTWLIAGCETIELVNDQVHDYNSALLIAPDGQVVARYFKMHPVMFGEYIPFGNVFPWLYQITPMRQGLSRGEGPVAFQVGDWCLSPSICFESTVPHLIRSHARQLARKGSAPHALVNVTDDGWFWGSSILDFQLACAVFRAVELRRPMVVAANTGLSAWIDSCGRLRAEGPRRQPAILYGTVRRATGESFYAKWGDWPAAMCLMATCVFAAAGFRHGRRQRRSSARTKGPSGESS